MKKIWKKILSITLTLAMVLSMIPAVTVPTYAATTKDFSGSTVTGLGMSATDANGSGAPVCTWNASSNTINGSLVGGIDEGGLRKHYYESSTTLTLTNNLSKEAEISFTYSVTTSGSAYGDVTVNGTKHTNSVSNQFVSKKLASGESITITLHVPKRTGWGKLPEANGASVTITGIQLVEDNSVTITFGAATNGSYTVAKADGTVVDTSAALSAQAIDKFTLTATPASGYAFAGWYFTPEGGTETFRSGAATYENAIFPESGTVTAKFEEESKGVWQVGEAKFSDLAVALAAAQAGSTKVVVPLKDLTIDKNCTVPAGVTLLIPFDASFTSYGDSPESFEVPSDGVSDAARPLPKPYRTVTIADGVTVTVYGNIELAANHWASHGGGMIGGRPKEYYGRVVMNGASQIVLHSGANLYAWGYIIGSNNAKVIANSGATVYEKMQVTDYRGGSITTGLFGAGGLVKEGIFPFNQYYIQNVEVKEVIKSGATLVCNAAIYASGVNENTVSFMGSDGMFRLSSGAQVTKYYDAAIDRLIIDVEGTMSMNAVSIMGYDTSDFTLPLNNNLTINVKSGANVVINQHVALLPGAVINVDQGATLTVKEGKNAYLMDEDNWDLYCMGYKIKPLTYVAGRNAAPITRNPDNLGDAKLNLNGTLALNGAMYTSEANAQIISSDKTGKITVGTAVPTATSIYKQSKTLTYTEPNNVEITMNPAVLTNGNTTYPTTTTSGAAAGTTFYYNSDCNMWVTHGATGHKEETIAGKAATCTETGLTDGKKCSVCGTTTVAQTEIPATGHSYSEKVTKEPTCTEKGTKTFTCTCGDTYTEDIVAQGHTFETVSAKEATCLASGNVEHKKCTVCNKYFAADAENNSTAGADTNASFVIAQKPHSYTGAIKSDGDGKDATHSYQCVNGCGEYGGAVTHTWNGGVETTAPGCESTGVKTYTCTAEGCGATYTETVEAKGHNYNSVVTDPTCTEAGYTTHTCSVCGDSYKDTEVEATGHSPAADDGDCTTAISCTKCSTVTTAANSSHDWGTTATDSKHQCKNCDATIACVDGNDKDHKCDYYCGTDNLTEHTYSAEWATDGSNHWHECACGAKSEEAAHSDETTKDHKCDTCGYVMGECADSDDADHKCDHCGADSITEHDFGTEWKSDGEKHWKECACGEKNEVADHSDVTTDADHKCDVCEKDNVTEHKHNTYGSDETQHWSICDCGQQVGEKVNHDFTNGDCICGTEKPAATGLKGDLNGDGEVNSADLTLLARHVGGIEYITDSALLANADVNGDGEVNSADLTKHARYVGGIITDWSQQ